MTLRWKDGEADEGRACAIHWRTCPRSREGSVRTRVGELGKERRRNHGLDRGMGSCLAWQQCVMPPSQKAVWAVVRRTSTYSL